MSYFTHDFLDFFKELEENNVKEWFHEHKKRYEKNVKAPFHDFISDMIKRIQVKDPEVRIEPKDAIFRINRDIRFSPDKSPYKTHVAAVISRDGRKNHATPGFYIHLNHKQAMAGGGGYFISKEQLYTLRENIAADPKSFRNVVNNKAFKSKFGEIKGEKNKVLPKEFKEAAEKEPLIYNKQFYYMADLDPEVVLEDNLPELMMEYFNAGNVFNVYLNKVLFS